MRYFQYKKPVSMLVHTSSKQPAHEAVTNQIREWLIAKRDTIPNECKELYHTETNRFTKVILRESFPQYGIPDDQIWDYPKFDDIKPYIIELVSKVTSIRMSELTDEIQTQKKRNILYS